MTFGIDFDNTIVYNMYPKIGQPVKYALETLREIAERHHIILFTMRDEKELYEAEIYLRKHGIPLYGINVNPTQSQWTGSPKAYCDYYIDDRAIGTPLNKDGTVDWIKVKRLLTDMNLL